MFDIGNRFADGDVLDAGEADDVAGGRLGDLDPLQPLEREELRDLCFLHLSIELAHGDRVADLDAAVEHASDRDPPEVVARIEICDKHLERRVDITARRRDVVHDRVEQRTQILSRLVRRQAGGAGTGARVQHRKVELLLRRVEIDEEVVDFVQDFLNASVRAIDLVDDDDRRQPALERLAQDEARLRQRPLGRVHEQQHAVDHRQRAFDLAAEVRVTRRVDDVDEHVAVVNRGVLGQNRDPTLALEVGVVHRALDDALVGAEDAALVEQRVNEGGLAVVDVGDDGDVAPERVGDGRAGLLGRGHLSSVPPKLGFAATESASTEDSHGKAAQAQRFRRKDSGIVDTGDQLSYRVLRHMGDMCWRLESGRDCQT